MSIIHVISFSTGKDSQATLELAIKRFGKDRILVIFCDTGNENVEVYKHLHYIELAYDIQIMRLRAEFSEQIAEKRKFIARDKRHRREYERRPIFEADGKTPVWARDGFGNVVLNQKGNPIQKTVKIGSGRRVRWTNKAKRRALEFLKPTGNPFLDLCMWKGRFPSRKAQFCTEELKRNPAVEFQLSLIDQGHTVVSWQGIRRDESAKRKDALKFEILGDRLYIYRPIVEWTADQVFALIKFSGVQPNPLYKMGMGRVGCMPCINAKKEEVREINKRFPEEFTRIGEWEWFVAECSKRSAATFFPAIEIKNLKNKQAGAKQHGIWSVVEWSKTKRGGKQYDTLADVEDTHACASSYGLCDQ